MGPNANYVQDAGLPWYSIAILREEGSSFAFDTHRKAGNLLKVNVIALFLYNGDMVNL